MMQAPATHAAAMLHAVMLPSCTPPCQSCIHLLEPLGAVLLNALLAILARARDGHLHSTAWHTTPHGTGAVTYCASRAGPRHGQVQRWQWRLIAFARAGAVVLLGGCRVGGGGPPSLAARLQCYGRDAAVPRAHPGRRRPAVHAPHHRPLGAAAGGAGAGAAPPCSASPQTLASAADQMHMDASRACMGGWMGGQLRLGHRDRMHACAIPPGSGWLAHTV